jgi:hypothetical protein
VGEIENIVFIISHTMRFSLFLRKQVKIKNQNKRNEYKTHTNPGKFSYVNFIFMTECPWYFTFIKMGVELGTPTVTS